MHRHNVGVKIRGHGEDRPKYVNLDTVTSENIADNSMMSMIDASDKKNLDESIDVTNTCNSFWQK